MNIMTEEKQIEDMDKEIAELEKKKAELAEKGNEIVGIVPDTPKNRKIMEEASKTPEPPKKVKKEKKEKKQKKEKFVPPDPSEKIIGNIYIEWIDGRYHVNGIHGIPGGNKIIVRALSDINRLVVDLLAAVKNFNQKEMISTKK